MLWINLTPEIWWNEFADEYGLFLPRHYYTEDLVPAIGGIDSPDPDDHTVPPRSDDAFFGWPLVAARAYDDFHGTGYPGGGRWTRRINYFGYAETTVDCITALAILFAVWFVCERWIAWRAGRKKG